MKVAKPLRIGFDVSALDPNFKAHAHRGIGRYVAELKRAFEGIQSDKVTIATFDHRVAINGNPIIRPLHALAGMLPVARQTVRNQLLYPLSLSARELRAFDYLHFPAHMDAPAWSTRSFVLTVLDLIPLVLEDLYRANNPSWRFTLARFLELRAIRQAKLILAISETTARDTERLLHIPPERIVVTPLGVDKRFFKSAPPTASERNSARNSWNIPEDRPVILYVGGIDPRKNCIGMLHALAALRDELRNASKPEPLLVHAGHIQTDKDFPRYKVQIENLGLTEHVRLLGFVPDERLIELFALADLFLFLSLYEGFGLPPLEALAAKLPVVSANTACMPEVLGDSALLVDPKNPKTVADAMHTILHNPERRLKLIEQGTVQAMRFTWSETARKTVAAYERLL
jgi:glycosyltransferase involved in cell wall biosynthesis